MIYEIWHKFLEGGLPPERGIAKDADIVKGQPVFRDVSDGDLDGCATNGVKVLGIADETPASGAEFKYTPVDKDTWLLLDWAKGSAIAATDVGKFFDMVVTSGDLSVVLTTQNNKCLKLERRVTSTENAAGTAGKAWFSFIPAVRQYDAIETA